MPWDGHNNIESNHRAHSRQVDKPIAGLLADLEARGLLESTLVVWTSEFGRTPFGQSGNGRDHNPWGYTQWMAGGGVKAGTTVGGTDEIGMQAVGKKVDTYKAGKIDGHEGSWQAGVCGWSGRRSATAMSSRRCGGGAGTLAASSRAIS